MRTLTSIAASALIAASSFSAIAAPNNHVVRIMPLGDSITAGLCDGRLATCVSPVPSTSCNDINNQAVNTIATGYRTYLKQALDHIGIWSDFVGSMSSSTGFSDPEHEGHGGWQISDLSTCVQQGWIANAQPDVVLIHAGTNDIIHGRTTSQLTTDMTSLINSVYSAKSDVVVIVAQMIPMTSYKPAVSSFNNSIPAIVSQQQALGRKVYYVNMNRAAAGADPQSTLSDLDLHDGLHPNQVGYELMAKAWGIAIQNAVKQVESITTTGRYWNFWEQGSNSYYSDYLSSVPNYQMICGFSSTCKFDTRTIVGDIVEIESITAYGSYWNFDVNTGALIGSGSLNSIPRYENYICSGRVPCTFDTRTFKTEMAPSGAYKTATIKKELITAYGNYYEFSGNTLVSSGPLTSTAVGAQVCAANYTGQPCKYDSRNIVRVGSVDVESIIAYGRYWNFDMSGNSVGSGYLNSVPRYQPICSALGGTCGFDTRMHLVYSFK